MPTDVASKQISGYLVSMRKFQIKEAEIKSFRCYHFITIADGALATN